MATLPLHRLVLRALRSRSTPTLLAGALLAAAPVGVARAAPADLVRATAGDDDAPVTMLARPPAGASCAPGRLCLFPVVGSTVVAPAPAAPTVASDGAAPAPAARIRHGGAAAEVAAPAFSRGTAAASSATRGGAPKRDGEDGPGWSVDLVGSLKHRALAGNALFLFVDADDPDAVANKLVTAMYQAALPGGQSVAARLTLSPGEGFRAGHTYQLRVLQIVHGKEIPLAETAIHLL